MATISHSIAVRITFHVKLLLIALTVFLAPLKAADFKIDISQSVNFNYWTGASGTNNARGGTTTNIAGIPFAFTSFPGTSNGLGVVFMANGTASTPAITNFPVRVTNAVTVYTMINSSWGQYGATNGTIDFYGSEGAHARFHLVQGFNIRDHFNGPYNNSASSNLMSIYFGSNVARNDVQGWMLPPSFLSQALTNIQLRSFGNNPNGTPVVTAITVRTSGPEVIVRNVGSKLTCYWPSSPTNFILQSTVSLENPEWRNATNSPFITNNQFAITNAANSGQRFFRLISLP
jgi:hypothetical protein